MQLFVFRLQSRPRRQHRFGDALQCGLAGDQLLNPRLKSLARHRTDLQAKAAQDPSDAQLHVDKSPKKLLARNQQRPYLLRSHRFGVYWAELAHPDHLSKPARILAIRLHRHR